MRKNHRRGATSVEFALAGVASALVLLSTFQLAWAMWNYHTIALMVHEATRYVAVRGVGCTKPGNTCSVSVGKIAQQIKTTGIGIPTDRVNVTFKTEGGTTTTCAPLSSCLTNTTVWPPATNKDNDVGKLITISAVYEFRSAITWFWPGQGAHRIGSFSLPASSTQTIVF